MVHMEDLLDLTNQDWAHHSGLSERAVNPSRKLLGTLYFDTEF